MYSQSTRYCIQNVVSAFDNCTNKNANYIFNNKKMNDIFFVDI